VKEFSTSSLIVIKPNSEKALNELGERNPSENKTKELVENGQETEANPIRKVKSAISGEGIIINSGLGGKVSGVKDAQDEVDEVVGKDEKNKETHEANETNSVSDEFFGSEIGLLGKSLEELVLRELVQLEVESNVINNLTDILHDERMGLGKIEFELFIYLIIFCVE